MPSSEPEREEARAWERGSNTELRSAWLTRVLSRRLAPGTEVLEVGARTGTISAGLTRAGLRVCGVEQSAELVAVAAAKKPPPLVIASVTRLPFAPGCFGAAVTTSLREYDGAPDQALTEICRVLRPGGPLILAVPDPGTVARDPIGLILRPMRERLQAATATPHTATLAGRLAAIDAACDRLGLICHTERLPPYGYLQSPAQEARDICARASSLLWGVPAAVWAEVVTPAVDALLGLPDPERPITRHAHYMVIRIAAGAGRAT